MDCTPKICNKCGMPKPRTEYYAYREGRDGLRARCKSCMNRESKGWYDANKDHHALLVARWSEKNADRLVIYRKERRETHGERDRAAISAWKKANRKLVANYTAKRRAAIKRATPAWASIEEMAMWQEVADTLSRSGVRFEVDHVVPIVSKIVCGLHWEGNMQVLPRHINIAKQNRYWPDMP